MKTLFFADRLEGEGGLFAARLTMSGGGTWTVGAPQRRALPTAALT